MTPATDGASSPSTTETGQLPSGVATAQQAAARRVPVASKPPTAARLEERELRETWAPVTRWLSKVFGSDPQRAPTAAQLEEQELRETWAPVTRWLSKVFESDPQRANWPRAVMVLDVLLVPLIVFWAIGSEQYLLSAVFAVLFAAVADPGGAYGYRALRLAGFGLLGAGVTAGGFALGGVGWGWLVLAAFVVTLAGGLAIGLGVHRFVAAQLLNIWFIIALVVAVGLHPHTHIASHTWIQLLSWLGGTGLWIALTFVGWLIRGRKDRPEPFQEIPGDTSLRPLTPPLIMFALLRALAIAGTFALAYGLNLKYGYWMAIAAFVAMKPSVEQSALVGAQRVAGALIGAAIAGLLLIIPANEHGLRVFAIDRGLEVVALVLVMHAFATRFMNYALYYTAISAAVLLLSDVLHPSNYSAEGYRVAWALAGVGIGVLVMLFAGLLGKVRARSAKVRPQPA